MRRATVLLLLLVIPVVTTSAEDPSVIWGEVLGIVATGNVVGSGTGAVNGGFLPWTTTLGGARLNVATGHAQFVVKGLVLGGGNGIGTRGDITAVRATLVCDTNGSAGGGNSVQVQAAAVPLSLEGDAHFSGDLGNLPAVCSSEPDLAFLIRIAEVNGTAVNGPWIAYGAVRKN